MQMSTSVRYTSAAVAVNRALTLRAAIPVTVLQDLSVMEPNVLVSRVNIRNVHVCPRHDSSFLEFIHAHIKEYLLGMPKNVIVGQITDIYNLQLISLHANLGYLLFLSCHWQTQTAQKSSHC